MPKPTTATSNQVMPDPLLEKRTRRTFSADYKLRMIREADVCQHGELGPLLRREKLYAPEHQNEQSLASVSSPPIQTMLN